MVTLRRAPPALPTARAEEQAGRELGVRARFLFVGTEERILSLEL